MAPTIKDVAKNANVSIATVSRILNSRPGYSEATKKRVLKSITDLGYQPNAVARGLINKRTQTIGIMFPDVSSMFSSAIFNGVEDAAHELGHSVIVCHTASHGKRTMKYLQLLREKQVDGIIYVSGDVTEEYNRVLTEMDVPVVLISSESQRYKLPYVKVDDRSAIYHAAEYLIKQGHKKIGMISGPIEDKVAGLPRVMGFKQALTDNGIDVTNEEIVLSEGFSYKEGIDCLPILLKKNPSITAVVAASDEIAIGAIAAAYKLGICVPDELSIIGYDNLKIAEMSTPPLTTVAQPLYELGMVGASMLLTMLQTGEKVASKIMPHEIIERGSVKKL